MQTKPTRYELGLNNLPPFNQQQRAEIEALKAMREETIDMGKPQARRFRPPGLFVAEKRGCRKVARARCGLEWRQFCPGSVCATTRAAVWQPRRPLPGRPARRYHGGPSTTPPLATP